MTRFPKRWFALLMVSMGILLNSACAQETQDPMLSQLEGVLDSLTGDIDFRGRIVSTDGKPLEDVTLKYFFREFGDVLVRKEIDYKYQTVDGDFRIKKRGVSSLAVSFLKEGYYPETWSYSFSGDDPSENQGDRGKFDIEIVLEKEATPAPLNKFRGMLRADVRGAVSVVEVKRQNGRESWLWRNGKLRDLDWPHLLLETANTGEAGLSVVNYLSENEQHEKPGLERGWIQFSHPDPGDGFIVYEADKVHPVFPETGMREMTSAPESGYVDQLELRTENGLAKVFFYCRHQGQFGKGMVTGRPYVAEEDDRQVARALVELYLNPTGARDVSYIHD